MPSRQLRHLLVLVEVVAFTGVEFTPDAASVFMAIVTSIEAAAMATGTTDIIAILATLATLATLDILATMATLDIRATMATLDILATMATMATMVTTGVIPEPLFAWGFLEALYAG